MAEISNSAANTVVSGTDDADRIFNQQTLVTIRSGAGSDTVYNNNGSATFAFIEVGDGDNYVYNLGADSTIIAGDGQNTINNSAQRVDITAGSGKDSLRNNGAYSTIRAGSGDDSVYNSAAQKQSRQRSEKNFAERLQLVDGASG